MFDTECFSSEHTYLPLNPGLLFEGTRNHQLILTSTLGGQGVDSKYVMNFLRKYPLNLKKFKG